MKVPCKTILLFLLAGLSLNHVIAQEQFNGKSKDIHAIQKQISLFSGYVMASDYEQIANAYTPDGKLFPPNKGILEGHDQIKAYWTLPEGVSIIYHKITPQGITVTGKEAYDYGYYEGTTRKANGEEVSWRGKYVIVWKKIGKEWKIYLDGWNRIVDDNK
ncbi:MAG: nuclear transport factor 2 family protein [Flavobacteriales bacterium]|nr:nuclear transport factor 2 family protein [Flavobacteriales bacterium]